LLVTGVGKLLGDIQGPGYELDLHIHYGKGTYVGETAAGIGCFYSVFYNCMATIYPADGKTNIGCPNNNLLSISAFF
jgi:hypothetical protein